MNTLYYLGKPEDGFGWGVANTNLVAALSKLCNVVVDTSPRTDFDAPVFVPVVDSGLHPLRKVKAPRLLGYCFTEWPIEDRAHVEARQYDILFAGSTWNCDRLKATGVKRTEPLLQGVDSTLFNPRPPSTRKGFVVFSGGKYEFRKGQDYVIAAMKHFMKARSDVVLIAAWHNPWPESTKSMNASWLIDPKNPLKDLPEDRCILIPQMPNANTPSIYEQAHIGLFPNRCEAGTNLVMCEFMACGRPVIASYAHGHKDVFQTCSCWTITGSGYPVQNCPTCGGGGGAGSTYPYLLKAGSYDYAGWFNPNVSDILHHLEHAYKNQADLPASGLECASLTKSLTWEACAQKIFKAAFET